MKKKMYVSFMLLGAILLLVDNHTLSAGSNSSEEYAERIKTSTSLKEVWIESRKYTVAVTEVTCTGTGKLRCKAQNIERLIDVRDTSPFMPIV